jgi:hypothetical protein
MHFFKNGTGWCQRYNPNRKIAKISRAHAPVFRNKTPSVKLQAPSSSSTKRQASSPE